MINDRIGAKGWRAFGAIVVLATAGPFARADEVPPPDELPRREDASVIRPVRDAPAEAVRADASPPRKPALDLSPSVIRQAVKDSIDPADEIADARAKDVFGTAPLTRQQRIDRAFADAQIPTCMTMGAWKFAPPMLGPIPIPGIFAAPFLVRNIVTGKCRN